MKNDPLIPRKREMSTGARMLLVADILENHPERHDQTVFVSQEDGPGVTAGPVEIAETRNCGTAACVAGWAVACSPPALIRKSKTYRFFSSKTRNYVDEITWDAAGAKALGLEADLADNLFYDANKRPRLVKALRVLSELDPKDRTNEKARELGITFEWLMGEGRADQVKVPK